MMEKLMREVYGETLVELAEKMENMVACDADLATATMSCIFRDKYPDRFFDFGIAEQNLMCASAGMSFTGLIPFVSSFALFGAGRGFEMIRNSIGYTHANVKICLSHCGVTLGADGGSHQCIEDMALMRTIPGMTIFSPCDPIELRNAIFAASEIDGPVYIRIPRCALPNITNKDAPFLHGKAVTLRKGGDLAILATGFPVHAALEAAEQLETEGISAAVIDVHTVKPLDEAFIGDLAVSHRALVTVEDHGTIGGLGAAVAELLAELPANPRFAMVGVKDSYGFTAMPEELAEAFGLTPAHIAQTARTLLK